MKPRASRIAYALAALLGGLLLIAAALPGDYWQHPAATTAERPHWPKLEQNMRPEACAQCHAKQFKDWQHSLHAKAYSEGMIGQFPGMGDHSKGNQCLVCHAPLQEQAYTGDAAMLASLKLKIRQPEAIPPDTDVATASRQPLSHTGVSCAACHVRQWQRFGPPRATNPQTGHIVTSAHGGFTASEDFEQATFCASCHQFAASRAINGKPLENTVKEWQDSRFAAQGVSCQQCHMPDRRHLFKGIHDPDTVRQGVQIELTKVAGEARLSIHSTAVGHAFPTYVTPRVDVLATARDGEQRVLKQWQWPIIREVRYQQGAWQEIRDTRIMPDETRVFRADQAPPATRTVSFQVRVVPDAYYRALYERSLNSELTPSAKTLLQRALERASHSEFDIFNDAITVKE